MEKTKVEKSLKTLKKVLTPWDIFIIIRMS